MSSPRCKFSLGKERFVQVIEWKGELRVDLRAWENNYPTKKGVSLFLMQYKNLLAGIEAFIDPALKDDKEELFHLGANVFMKVRKLNPCVDIRLYWKPPNHPDAVPTKKGLCLRPKEYNNLKSFIPDIEKMLPELENVIPCYMQDDHMDQLGMMRCKYCNPEDYMNW